MHPFQFFYNCFYTFYFREEIQLATALYEAPVSVNTRVSFDLRRIVEDQVSIFNYNEYFSRIWHETAPYRCWNDLVLILIVR